MYNFLNYAIISRVLGSLNPFIYKKIIDNFTPLELLYIFSCLTFLIMSILFYLFHKDNTTLSKITTNYNVLFLILTTVIIFIIATFIKLYIYKHEFIVKARPTLIAIGIISTLLWGKFIFKEKISKNIVLATSLIIIAIYLLNKEQ